MNQSSKFFGDSFSNRDNVRAPIQFRGESQSQHLKRDDFSNTFSKFFRFDVFLSHYFSLLSGFFLKSFRNN